MPSQANKAARPSPGMRLDALLRGVKSLWSWDDSGWTWYGNRQNVPYDAGSSRTPAPYIDYAAEVGDLSGNSAIMACIQWVMRNFPQSPAVVRVEQSDGQPKIVPGHPMTALLRAPNPYYSGARLWQATCFSYNLSSNAYWVKVRNGSGRVIQLWYEPHFTIRPSWNSEEFISHYELYRAGKWLTNPDQRIPREDVVHFRFGMNPYNPRYGLPQLASALLEVYTDREAASYTATLLRNMGVVGVVISPPAGEMITNPEEIKSLFMAKFTGNNRGEPLVNNLPLNVVKLSYNPTEFDLANVRQIPVERICSLLGISRMLVGLGPDPKYSNMREAREGGYEENIIPSQMDFASDLTSQLLPDLSNNTAQFVEFDTSKIRALQEDQNGRVERIAARFNAGYITVNEARVQDELQPLGTEGDVYKVPANVALVPLSSPEASATSVSAVLPALPMLNGSSAPKSLNGHEHGVKALDLLDSSTTGAKLTAKFERDVAAYLEDDIMSVAGHVGG